MNIKRTLALFIALIMLIPMCLQVSAMDVDPNLTANWNTLAAKYSNGTWKIVAPKANNYKIKTDGFTFNTSENDGISVVTPDYQTFMGTYGVSAVTSNAKTELDGLSVVITPDKYDSMLDSLKAGNIIGILWTEEKITEIAKYNESSSSYDKGLYTAVQAYDTGLRHLIPTAENATPLTPATDSKATPIGQALYISLTCNVAKENNAPIATSVRIVYYDGYYMNDDGNPGYRWIFTARNHSDTLNSDSTRLSQPYESVDMSKGIAINIRADEEHGFIVNINGYDYYRGEDVAYFPDAKQDWYGYKTNSLNDDKIEESDPLYLDTMTYAKADIDLSGLKTAGKGYVTVGAVSNNDKNLEDHGCNYTVDTINGIPAATWNGEAVPEHECDFVYIEAVEPNCTRDGYNYYRCSVCGKHKTDNITPHIEHIAGEMKKFEDPACDNYGTMASHCTICKRIVDSYAIPKTDHKFTDDVTILKEATCNTDGLTKKHCSSCGKDYEIVVPADPSTHVIQEPSFVIETIDGATDWFGKVCGICSGCEENITETVDMYSIVDHFTDVKANHWFMSEVAYCVSRGYVSGMNESSFAPNNNLTRAQFLTLLAKLDGVDLTQYDTTNAGFTDVKTDHWFNEVVCWAVEKGYTSGISETKFGPNNNITRAQLARFFYVYTDKTGGDVTGAADLSVFPDNEKVQAWAESSVKWAVAQGLIAGINGNLVPNGNATRAQAARIIMLYTAETLPCTHEFGEWIVTKEATYTEEGEQTKTCTICGATETEAIPVLVCEEHSWSEWIVTREPTLEMEGERKRSCTLCGIEVTDSYFVPVLYHRITFDLKGGEMPNGYDTVYEIRDNDDLVETIGSYPVPLMDNMIFKGWYYDGYGCTITEEDWIKYSLVVSSDMTFTAVWEEVPKGYTLTFDANDGTFVNNAPIVYNINLGEYYDDVITEMPVAEKEGYVFKGWWNRERRVSVNGINDGAFDIYIPNDPITGFPTEDIDMIDKNITLIPIWSPEGDKDWTIRFENPYVDGFEPLEYGMNVRDTYMSVFAGDFPSPDVYQLDEYSEFVGWYNEEVDFLLTEDDMWDQGYLALAGGWTFIALYAEI